MLQDTNIHKLMKTNKLNWITVVLLPLMFLCTECNEEVSDGVITYKMRNDNNGGIGFTMCKNDIRIDRANNFYSSSNGWQEVNGEQCLYQDGEFVDMGTKRISKIKNIPTQGWAREVAVLPGHGYIFRTKRYRQEYIAVGYYDYVTNWDGSYWYGRIYVVGYDEEASDGGIIGAEVQYKESSTPGVLD